MLKAGACAGFFDFVFLPSDKWLLVFVHGFLHAMDTTLERANRMRANPKNIKRVQEITQSKDKIADLTPEELFFLRDWVHAGLDVGQFAQAPSVMRTTTK